MLNNGIWEEKAVLAKCLVLANLDLRYTINTPHQYTARVLALQALISMQESSSLLCRCDLLII